MKSCLDQRHTYDNDLHIIDGRLVKLVRCFSFFCISYLVNSKSRSCLEGEHPLDARLRFALRCNAFTRGQNLRRQRNGDRGKSRNINLRSRDSLVQSDRRTTKRIQAALSSWMRLRSKYNIFSR